MSWQLVYTLEALLSPVRLAYPLEPDITTAADFGIPISSYIESDSIFSPKLPIPALALRLSDFDAAEQPGMCAPIQMVRCGVGELE